MKGEGGGKIKAGNVIEEGVRVKETKGQRTIEQRDRRKTGNDRRKKEIKGGR